VFGDLTVQVTELGVPVGVLIAFQDLQGVGKVGAQVC